MGGTVVFVYAQQLMSVLSLHITSSCVGVHSLHCLRETVNLGQD